MARESKAKRDARRFGKAERFADLMHEFDWSMLPRLQKNREAAEHYENVTWYFRDIVKQCPIFIIDNVREYFSEKFNDSGKIDYGTCIPCWTPPFPKFFAEFADVSETPSRCRHGFFVETYDRSDPGSMVPEKAPIPDDCVKVMRITCLIAYHPHRLVIGPLGFFYVFIDRNGCNIGGPRAIVAGGEQLDPEGRQEILDGMGLSAGPLFFSLAFLNCKNVISVQSSVPSHNPERKKHGMRPFLRYNTINYTPIKRVVQSVSPGDVAGFKRALHLVRTHMVTLTRNNKGEPLEKPTLYVRESHVRGSAREGVVISDYRVSPPKSQNT